MELSKTYQKFLHNTIINGPQIEQGTTTWNSGHKNSRQFRKLSFKNIINLGQNMQLVKNNFHKPNKVNIISVV